MVASHVYNNILSFIFSDILDLMVTKHVRFEITLIRTFLYFYTKKVYIYIDCD